MSTEKSTAIVLRVVDFSETSAVVTLLTRDFGKITALAKGARRKKSPFEAALDVLAICRIVFLHKNTDAMDLLTEAKLDRRFRNRSGRLERLYAAYYVVELLGAMTDTADPHPELYDLAEQTLAALDQPGSDESQRILKFELGAMKLLGQLPLLTHCVDCGREKPAIPADALRPRRVNFGLNEGGILCTACRRGKTNVISLSHDAWQTLVDHSDLTRACEPLDWPERISGEIRQTMNQVVSHLLGRRPRLQPYISPTRTPSPTRKT